MTGKQLPHSREERVLAERGAVIEILMQHLPAGATLELLGGEDRLDLGSEDHEGPLVMVVKRFDPEPITGEMELLLSAVPDRHREHPIELAECARAPLLESLERQFGVRTGPERNALRFEAAFEFGEVVDFAVVDDGESSVIRSHRLMALGRKIDDAETRVPEARGGRDQGPAVVGSAVTQTHGHAGEGLSVDPCSGEIDHSADPAHQ